jgi:hypothetical protein
VADSVNTVIQGDSKSLFRVSVAYNFQIVLATKGTHVEVA